MGSLGIVLEMQDLLSVMWISMASAWRSFLLEIPGVDWLFWISIDCFIAMFEIESAPKNFRRKVNDWFLKKDLFNYRFIFTFQPDGCSEPTCAATCFIHFGHYRPDNNRYRLLFFFSSETYARGVFICLFIYSFCWWVRLECIYKSAEISVYDSNKYWVAIKIIISTSLKV